MKYKLSSIAENIFGKNKNAVEDIPTSSNVKADETFIIPEQDRGNAWTRFMVTQAGGYDPQYYNKQEAKSTTVLAAAKFVSVSMATYAFMKAVAPAFESEALSTLPSVGNADPRLILAGGVAAGFWWGVSKLDTAVMHSMRAQKASKYAADNLGVNTKGREGSFTGTMFRLGISFGALGLTIPALLLTTSEKTIDQYIMNKNKELNNVIIAEYAKNNEILDTQIAQLQKMNSQLRIELFGDEEAKKEGLLRQDADLRKQETDLRKLLLEVNQKYNDAVARQKDEELGTRGAVAGKFEKYNNAVADRNEAANQWNTLNNSLEQLSVRQKNLQDKIDKVQQSISANENKIDAYTKKITPRDDLISKAKDDPRYTHFNPDLAGRGQAYIEYMSQEAHPLEWGRVGFLALMIISLELGVFALASSRRVNAGEVRGYLADIAKSEEAADLYHQIVAKREAQKQEETMTSMDVLKKRKIMETDNEIFIEALEKLREDPKYLDQAVEDVLRVYEEMRMQQKPNKSSKPKSPGNGPA